MGPPCDPAMTKNQFSNLSCRRSKTHTKLSFFLSFDSCTTNKVYDITKHPRPQMNREKGKSFWRKEYFDEMGIHGSTKQMYGIVVEQQTTTQEKNINQGLL